MLKAETVWLLSTDLAAHSSGTRLRLLPEISECIGHVPSPQITPPFAGVGAVINVIPFLGDELLDASRLRGELKTNRNERD